MRKMQIVHKIYVIIMKLNAIKIYFATSKKILIAFGYK